MTCSFLAMTSILWSSFRTMKWNKSLETLSLNYEFDAENKNHKYLKK